jgi:hypothetical protein
VQQVGGLLPERHSPVETSQRLRIAFQNHQHIAPQDQRIEISGLYRQRAVQGRQRLFGAHLPRIYQRELMMDLRIVGRGR